MSVRHTLLAATIVSAVAFAMSPASGQTLRYANQGELKSLDPYTLKETTTIAHHAHVYEGLVTRDKELKLAPALAESWETPEPTRWRFHLRKNVKFHNGDPFTADDVIFSADRVRAQGSNFLTNVPADAKFVKVDDYTVDVKLDSANPILISQWDGWYIMDKKWCEENNAVAPTPVTNLPQQLTVTNSELPASQLPSAVRRRELLATRNLMTSWSPTLRPCGSLTMLPTTVMDVSNIANSSHFI